jgi:cytochrome P450
MIARLEGEIVIAALARKVKTIQLNGRPVIHYNNSVRGYDSMPMHLSA